MNLLKFIKSEKSKSANDTNKPKDQIQLSVPKCNYDFVPNTCALDPQSIGKIPTIEYLSNFIFSEDGARLFDVINSEGHKFNRWTILKTRKLQCYDQPTLFPSWLQSLTQALVYHNIFDQEYTPNHILINYYAPGQGILHHVDGPTYYPKVAILSLGSSILMTFRKYLSTHDIGNEYNGDLFSILLQSNSLLLFSDSIYTEYMHGIHAQSYDIIGRGNHLENITVNNINNNTINPTSTTIQYESYDDSSSSSSSSSTSIKNISGVECLNKDILHMKDGEIINRETRISLTFRYRY